MQNRAGIPSYDHLTFAPLLALGWRAVEVPWDRSGVDWSTFDAVVIRSTWDYHRRPEQFLNVLAAIEASGVPLWNPLRVCRWNFDKRYLRDLAARGVAIVPTRWSPKLDANSLTMAFDSFACERLVVKPQIGASAEGAFALPRREPEAWQDALRTLAGRTVMVQPFVQAIIDEGEYSLFYFAGEFSHAILKTPQRSDFRVQEEYGATLQAVTADAALAAAGQRALDAVGEVLLYARVDLTRSAEGTPLLMELELIEPSLYFPFDEESPARFAQALDRLARG